MTGYFAGLAATNMHVPILSPEEMKHVQEGVAARLFLSAGAVADSDRGSLTQLAG